MLFFRFFLGALIAYDLVVHFSDLNLFFSDQGIFTRDTAFRAVTPAWWSIYGLSSQLGFTFTVYFIHLLVALAFMAGIGLPWITPILWIFQFSLRNRNVAIMDGSDDLSIVLLFFAMWLPLTKKIQTDSNRFFQNWIDQPVWHLVLAIQVMCLYSFSALQKFDETWTSNFTAISLALRLDILVNPFGHWLIQFPTLLKVMTATVYHLELFGPLIYLIAALSSTRTAVRVQQAVCIAFIAFHLGLSATLRLGVFPYYCIAAWFLLFPTVNDLSPSDDKGSSNRILKTQWPSLVVSIISLVTILTMNAKAVQKDAIIAAPIRWFANHFSLHQNWGMFAPFPALDNFHIRTVGTYADGAHRELGDESFWLENRHRVKYWLNMDLKRSDFLTGYALYWCRHAQMTQIPEPLLKETKVISAGKVANKKDAKIETSYSREIWIQPCPRE